MPHIIVKTHPGFSDEQKTTIAEALTRALMSSSGKSEASISVAIEDVAPAEWTETVYKPDIAGKWEQIYKKPGYEPT
jgi:4-oxalocrotonate tautomerase